MNEDQFPEASDRDDLEERPYGDENNEEGVEGKRRSFNEFCNETSKTGYE